MSILESDLCLSVIYSLFMADFAGVEIVEVNVILLPVSSPMVISLNVDFAYHVCKSRLYMSGLTYVEPARNVGLVVRILEGQRCRTPQ